MSKVVLMKIGSIPIYWDESESKIWYTSEFTIDADGCPRAYGPEGCSPEPLDYLANAGYDGNWWGIVTDSYGDPYVQEKGNKKSGRIRGSIFRRLLISSAGITSMMRDATPRPSIRGFRTLSVMPATSRRLFAYFGTSDNRP